MKYYKIGQGGWHTWEEWHNLYGYSTEPTDAIQLKSTGVGNEPWGAIVCGGYSVPVDKFADSSIWSENDALGWHDLNHLAILNGVWPATATEMQLEHPTLGTSNVAVLEFDDDDTRYLIQKDLEQGWMTEAQYTARGWMEAGTPEFIMVDSDTGSITGRANLFAMGYGYPSHHVVDTDPNFIMVDVIINFPTISLSGDFGQDNLLYANTHNTDISVASGSSVLVGLGGGDTPTPVLFDSTKLYAVVSWSQVNSAHGSGRTEFAIVESSGNIYAENVSSDDLYLYTVKVAVCSDSTATIITVRDDSEIEYNAFKFTALDVDYYFVLDGTQTDWTNDLSSIGYHIPLPASMEVFFYLNNSHDSSTFSANDYWASVVIDSTDKAALEAFGITLYEYSTGKYVIARISLDNFSFEPIGLYSGVRTGQNTASMSNFYCGIKSDSSSGVYYGVNIWSRSAYSTSSMTWKCLITRNV